MAKKIKKGFFKVLPLSVVMLMIISISLGVWYSMPVHLAKAAALAPLATTYIDANADGTVDNIKLTFTDVTACTYEEGDWSVAVAGTVNVIFITGFTNSASCTTDEFINVAVITTPLTTGGVTDPQITYTNQGTLASVVADGNDGTATFTATDASKPFIKMITYKDADADGKIDRMTLAYTETVVAASVLAANDLTFSSVGELTGMAFGADATDLITGSVASTDVNLGTEATVVDTNDATGFIVDSQNAFSLVDGIPNTNATLGVQTQATYVDGAAPFMSSATYSDSNADGKVDRVAFAFSEVTTFSAITAADWVFSTAGDIGLVGDFALAECAGSGTLATITCTDAGTGTVDATAARTGKQSGAGVEPAFTYTNGTNNINDGGGGNNTPAFGPISLVDGAAPVIATTSPADNATGVELTASMVITFSETMTEASVTGAIARTPSFVLGTAAWTANSTVLTYAHSTDAFAGMQNYIITLAGTIASAATTDGNLGAGPVANPFDFTTVASGGGGGGGGGLPASVTVTTPNGGETLTGGGTYNITWSSTGTIVDPVSIYFSTDSGINFLNTVATGETNDGSYTWTVPNTATSTAKVKVVSGSLNDISDANFTITYAASAVSASTSTVVASSTSVVANGTSKSTVTVTVKDGSSNLLSGKTVTLASSRGTSDTVTTVTGTTGTNGVATFEVKSSTVGTSTYTATAAGVVVTQTASVAFAAPGTPGETPVSLSVGDLVKSSLSSSVYYYGSDGKRHVFPNEKTYKSWYVDFTGIKIISASQLQGISLGKNVTVRPGTVLVKIQTDPKVYAVEPGGLLRWVPTETRAVTLYGSAWATKIIDVPVIFWVDYTFGSDITTDKHPTGALVQYTGSTEKYYIQGTEKRLISTVGFTANKFQLSNVLTVPISITYTTGTALTVEETALTRIY